MIKDLQTNNALNNFGLKLFQLESKSENVFISPMSISIALTMAFAGARGQTANQLSHVLALNNQSNQEIFDLTKRYLTYLNELNQNVTLDLANKIYFKQGISLSQEYDQILKEYFQSEFQQMDFSGPKSSVEINKFVADKTKNKINKLIGPKDIDSNTIMILINAIYFKGNWLTKFDKLKTREEFFYPLNGEKRLVNMMTMTSLFVYKYNPAGLRAASCQFSYSGDSIAMTILLPHKGVEFQELEADLNTITVSEIMQIQSQIKVQVFVPKFRVEFRTEVIIFKLSTKKFQNELSSVLLLSAY